MDSSKVVGLGSKRTDFASDYNNSKHEPQIHLQYLFLLCILPGHYPQLRKKHIEQSQSYVIKGNKQRAEFRNWNKNTSGTPANKSSVRKKGSSPKVTSASRGKDKKTSRPAKLTEEERDRLM
jgi:hypothetical protein